MIKRILVPTDFSKCSTNAVRYAALLAKDMKAEELILLHAYSIPLTYGEAVISSVSETISESMVDSIEQNYSDLIHEVPELNSIPFITIHKQALISDAIQFICDIKKIDLIIMGTKGAHGLDEVLIGTNTYSIIKKIKYPVLVIPESTVYKSIQNIALASDYKSFETDILSTIKTFNKIYNSTIHIVHISENSHIESSEATEAKKIEQFLKNIPHHFHRIISEDVEEGLNSYLNSKNIDVLAIVPRKHPFFDRLFGHSESKKIIFHSKTPLLALAS